LTAERKARVVAIGGGTGLPIVLRSLRELDADLTAIVTMADDGGSSGKLREELGILPPGDIRNCLAALAGDPDSDLVRLLQYRFPTGRTLAEHSLGNFVIAGMADYEGGFAEAIDALSRLLDCRGQVMPSTLEDITLYADIGEDSYLAGQAKIARTELIRQVHIEPRNAPAYAPAVEAVSAADLIIIGPGSLFTSIIPNLLITEMAAAIANSSARKIFVLNTMNMRQETFGMSGSEYIEAILRHSSNGVIDTVLAHGGREPEKAETPEGETAQRVLVDADKMTEMGITVIAEDVADDADPLRNDPAKLAAVFARFIPGRDN
jgi:uncharacterized cofD-like protein